MKHYLLFLLLSFFSVIAFADDRRAGSCESESDDPSAKFADASCLVNSTVDDLAARGFVPINIVHSSRVSGQRDDQGRIQLTLSALLSGRHWKARKVVLDGAFIEDRQKARICHLARTRGFKRLVISNSVTNTWARKLDRSVEFREAVHLVVERGYAFMSIGAPQDPSVMQNVANAMKTNLYIANTLDDAQKRISEQSPYVVIAPAGQRQRLKSAVMDSPSVLYSGDTTKLTRAASRWQKLNDNKGQRLTACGTA